MHVVKNKGGTMWEGDGEEEIIRYGGGREGGGGWRTR